MIVIFSSSVFVLILHAFLLSCIFTATNGLPSDISCLKSIKDSMEDPLNSLSTWTFHDLTADSSVCGFLGVTCWNETGGGIISIKLTNKGLKGEFPPAMENCNSIQSLDLSGNDLFGPIPADLCKKLPYLTTLDLSSNSFSGEIPSTMSNCLYINILRLDHNQLTGQIPVEFHDMLRIKKFSVSNNMLFGPVPTFPYKNFTVESYANNKGLCGGPLERCKGPRWRKFDYSFKGGFVIGYAVSAVSTVTIFLSYCVPCVHVNAGRKKKITIAAMVMLLMRKKNRTGADHHQRRQLTLT